MRLTSIILALLTVQIHAADALIDPANVWVDRAIAELPGVRKESDQIKGEPDRHALNLSEMVIVQMIFDCRQGDAERALLLDLARRFEKLASLETTPTGKLRSLTNAQWLYVLAGARDDGRRLMPALNNGDGGLIYATAMAIVHERMGDLSDADVAKLPLLDLQTMMQWAADDGRPADVERYLAQARNTVGAPTKGNVIGYMMLAGAAAKSGKLAAASEIALRIPDGYQQTKALADIATTRLKAGDAAGSLESFKQALQTAKQAEESSRIDSINFVLRTAMEAENKAIIAQASDALWPEIKDMRGNVVAPRQLTEIAKAYAMISRKADFDRAIAAAQASIPDLDKKDQPVGWIEVAVAYARAGDRDHAQAAVAKSEALGGVVGYERDEFDYLAIAYAEAGDFDSALAAVKTHLAEGDKDYALERIAWRQILAGRFTDAGKNAALIGDPLRKFIVHARIAIQQTKAGHTDALPAWIASHGSAVERAALDLAVALQILGRQGKGNARLFDAPH